MKKQTSMVLQKWFYFCNDCSVKEVEGTLFQVRPVQLVASYTMLSVPGTGSNGAQYGDA